MGGQQNIKIYYIESAREILIAYRELLLCK